MKTLLTAATVAAAASLATAGNVTPGVIFGSGNANGSFTIAQGSNMEIGLRAKLRYDTNGQPQNTFNQVAPPTPTASTPPTATPLTTARSGTSSGPSTPTSTAPARTPSTPSPMSWPCSRSTPMAPTPPTP